MGKIQERLKELNIELPEPRPSKSLFVPAVTVDNLVYTSGNDCKKDGKLLYTGKVGSDLTIEQGQEAARQTMINLIVVLKHHIGDLDRVERIVKLLAFVSSAPGFVEQPYVINAASSVLIDVFGDAGKHARSAIGAAELPFDTPVEIEMIVQLKA